MRWMMLLLITSPMVAAPLSVDLLQHFESGNDGDTITQTILGNGDLGTLGGIFTSWNTADTAAEVNAVMANLKIEIDAARSPYTSFDVEGTPYSTAGTRGFRAFMNDDGAIEFNFTGGNYSITWGCFFRYNGPAVDSAPRDIFIFYNGIGGFQGLQLTDTNPSFHVHWQREAGAGGGGGIANDINFSRDTWYWITGVARVGTGISRISFYETSTWTLVGTSSTSSQGWGSTGASWSWCGSIKYGTTASQYVDFDNIVLVEGDVFPLGPGDGSGMGGGGSSGVTLSSGVTVSNGVTIQ